jgi:hypothetical protein
MNPVVTAAYQSYLNGEITYQQYSEICGMYGITPENEELSVGNGSGPIRP